MWLASELGAAGTVRHMLLGLIQGLCNVELVSSHFGHMNTLVLLTSQQCFSHLNINEGSEKNSSSDSLNENNSKVFYLSLYVFRALILPV